jgi:hypothetical protein
MSIVCLFSGACTTPGDRDGCYIVDALKYWAPEGGGATESLTSRRDARSERLKLWNVSQHVACAAGCVLYSLCNPSSQPEPPVGSDGVPTACWVEQQKHSMCCALRVI